MSLYDDILNQAKYGKAPSQNKITMQGFTPKKPEPVTAPKTSWIDPIFKGVEKGLKDFATFAAYNPLSPTKLGTELASKITGKDVQKQIAESRDDKINYYQGKVDKAKAVKGPGYDVYATIGEGVGNAIPQTALLLASGGASAAETIPTLAGNTGLTTAITSGIKTMASKPAFWTSFEQSSGASYNDAIANGATKEQAELTSTLTGLINSGIEFTGGMEALPQNVKKGGVKAVQEWVKTMFDEGKEEVVQGVVERMMAKMSYNPDAPYYSTTDQSAVFNPVTAAQEGGTGAVVGGLFGGGQIAANKIGTSLSKPINTVLNTNSNTTSTAQPSVVTAQNAPQAISKSTLQTTLTNTQSAPQANAEAQSTTPEGMGAASANFDPYTALQNKFGNLPAGENAVRSDDMPARTAENNKVSLAARTVLGAAATPDSQVEPIEKFVAAGKASYIPITNDETTKAAQKSIAQKGFATALGEWMSDVDNGKAGADVVATGAVLYNNAANAGDGKMALDVMSKYIELANRIGQSLQAQRILKTLTPSGKLYMIEKQVAAINKALKKPNAKKSSPTVSIDPALAEELITAPSDEIRNDVIDRMYQYIANQVPTNPVDMFTAIRYLNMLGNLKTQVRNVAGNTGSTLARATKDRVGAILEASVDKVNRLAGGKGIERTKAFVYDPKRFLAAARDFKNVREAAMGEAKYTSRTKTGVAEVEEKRTIFKLNSDFGTLPTSSTAAKSTRKALEAPLKFLELYRKITKGAMEYGDLGFSLFNYSDALAGYLAANKVSVDQMQNGTVDADLMDKARTYAIGEAQKATFRDRNIISDTLSGIGFKHPDNTAKRVVNAAIQGAAPFLRTPANVGVRMWEYSPLGMVNTIVEAVNAAKGKKGSNVSTVIDKLASAATGTALFAAGILALAKGVVFGGEDEDKTQQAFNETQGMQAYSILLPNGTTQTLDWLTPNSAPFFMGVEFAKSGLENGYTLKSVLESMASITEPMIKTSMLAGLNSQFKAVSYSDNPLMDAMLNALVSYATQGLTSTLGGQIERANEPYRMETFANANDPNLPKGAQYSIGKALAKVPGVDYQQIQYIDQWGRPQQNPSGLETFLSPSYSAKVNQSAMEKELQRLYDAYGKGGTKQVLPQKSAPKDFSYEGQKIEMTGTEYNQFRITQGQYAYNELTKLTASEAYSKMTDKEKADAVNNVWDDARILAKQTILEKRGEMYYTSTDVSPGGELMGHEIPAEINYTPKSQFSTSLSPKPQSQTYVLTDAEKQTFKDTYNKFFKTYYKESYTAEQLDKLKSKAYEAAKMAVIKSRVG